MGFDNVNLKGFGFGVQNKPQTVAPQPQAVGNIVTPTANIGVDTSKETATTQMLEAFHVIESEHSIGNVVAKNEVAIVQNINKKILQVKQELNKEIVNREKVIDVLFLSLISGQHTVLYGPPGTGKSMLIEVLNERITGSKYFQWQLNKTTDPSELFGPFSIKEMENDRFLRKTDGKMPEAQLVYLDECFKANSAVLNSLLSIMNERVFYNDGAPVPTDVMSIFASSNEFPDDESLEAFADRFVFKMKVDYSTSKTEVKDLLSSVYSTGNTTKTKLTLSDIKLMVSKAKNVVVPDSMIDTLSNFISEVRAGDIKVSDRKIVQCVQVMKANALLDDRAVIGPDDLDALLYILQDLSNPKSKNIIEGIIMKYANPEESKLKAFYDDFNELCKNILGASNEADRHSFISKNMKNFKHMSVELNTMISANKMSPKTTKKCNDLRDKIAGIVEYLGVKYLLEGESFEASVLESIIKK